MAEAWVVNEAKCETILITIENNPDGSPKSALVKTDGWAVSPGQGALFPLTIAVDYTALPPAVKTHVKELVRAASKGLSSLISEDGEVVLPDAP